MFPNPAQDQFTINLSEGLQLKKVHIFNQLGQLLHVATSSTIKTNNLPKGVYFVQIITNNGKATKKLLVE